MSNRYQAVAEILKAAQAQVNALLTSPEDELHRLKINQTLQLEADRILLITGTGDLTENKSAILGPATTIGGKPIGKLPKITEADLVPSDDKVFNLKQQVESALIYFGPNSDSAGILANIPELVIRGVAKKAGLKVTKDEPKEITVEFIEQVKEAVAIQQGLNDRLLPKVGEGGIAEVITVPIESLNTINQETPELNTEETKQPIPETEAAKPETDTPKPELEPKQEKKPKTGK
jgi:hypothetical protein